MEVISGFEGKDTEEFIERMREIWQREGAKTRGAKNRYQLITGRINNRAVFVPTVSTRAGTETLVIWNLSQEEIKKITEEAKNINLLVSSRPYVWFDGMPTVLPNESQEL